MPPVKRKRRNQSNTKKGKRLKEQNSDSPSNENILEQVSSESQELLEDQEADKVVAEESRNGEETKQEEEVGIEEPMNREEPKNAEDTTGEKEEPMVDEELSKGGEESSGDKEEETIIKEEDQIKKEATDEKEPENLEELVNEEEHQSAEEESKTEKEPENGEDSQNEEEDPVKEEVLEQEAEESEDSKPLEELIEEGDLEIMDQEFEDVTEDDEALDFPQDDETTFENPPDIKTLINKDTSPLGIMSKTHAMSETIRIRNLPPNMTKEALLKDLLPMYQEESDILAIFLTSLENSIQATVEFRRWQDAILTRNDLKGCFYKNRLMEVEFCRPNHERMTPQPNHLDPFHPKATNVVFIANLYKSKDLSKALKSYFSRFGEVKRVMTMSKFLRPYAFIRMESVAAAVSAIRTIITECEGKPVRLGFGQGLKNNALLVSNIPAAMDRKKLRACFSHFGNVGYLIMDRMKAQAIFFFHSLKSAEEAMIMMRGRKFHGQQLMVEMASSSVKEKFIQLLLKFESAGNFNPLEKETFEIKDKSQKVLDDKQRHEVADQSNDGSKVTKEDTDQLIEIPGLGTFTIKSSYP